MSGNIHRRLRFHGRYPDRSTVVRLEDLFRDPHGLVAGIFAFIGVDPLTHAQTGAILSDLPYGAAQCLNESDRAPEHGPIDRWKDPLTAEHRASIRQEDGPTAGSLGYELDPLRGSAEGRPWAFCRPCGIGASSYSARS